MDLRHTLAIVVETGCISANLLCPYEGQEFNETTAPDCRRYNATDEFPRLADMCLVGAAWDQDREDCLEVGGPPIEVAEYPIPVEYRWEMDEFYVTPVRANPAEAKEGD